MRQTSSPKRLRQKELVAKLFIFFSEKYDSTEVNSITDIELPMSEVREYLRSRVGIEYSSDAWIATQIHKYEEELGTKLFRRGETGDGPILGLYRGIDTYEQKRHLYITQKIRSANGVYDLFQNYSDSYPSQKTMRVLLEAGSTVTRVAEIIAENIANSRWNWDISTHNLGVIESLGKTSPGYERITINVPEGHFDPSTYLILGEDLDFYSRKRFDWIIQGTSFLSGGKLRVERPDEAELKSYILHKAIGRKVLVLTGHEATEKPPENSGVFGSIDDFDFIVFPALSEDSPVSRRLNAELKTETAKTHLLIKNWSYEILRLKRSS
jgi:hypothetical protein